MLPMFELSCTGRKCAAISATMLVTHAPSATTPRMAVRRRNHASATNATAVAIHAAVVTASNMFELGQRPEMYQRSITANVWTKSATAKTPIPIRVARGHR